MNKKKRKITTKFSVNTQNKIKFEPTSADNKIK